MKRENKGLKEENKILREKIAKELILIDNDMKKAKK